MRRFVPIALAACIVFVVFLFSPNFRTERGPDAGPYAGDFLHEWVGGYIVRAGDRVKLYDRRYAMALEHDADLVGFELRADAYLPMVYPPFYYLVVSPLSALAFRKAAALWAALSLGCLAGALALLGRAIRPGGVLDLTVPDVDPTSSPIWRIVRRWALPAAVVFVPVVENLASSQKGALSLLVFTATLLLMRRGCPMGAGLVFGLQSFKPQLALVIPLAFLAKREWRFVAGTACTVLVLAGLSLVVGLGPCAEYARFVTGVADYVREQPAYLVRSHCLYGFFTLLRGEPTPMVRVATTVTSAFTLWRLARLLAGPLAPSTPRFLAQFAGLVLATMLLSPHLLTYDLTILLLPLWLTAILLLRGALPRSLRRAALWLLVALYVAGGLSPLLAAWSRVQVSTPLMLGLLTLLSCVDGPGATPDQARRET